MKRAKTSSKAQTPKPLRSGDLQKLERLISLDGKASQWGVLHPITDSGTLAKPANPPAKVLKFIEAHSWDLGEDCRLSGLANHPPEIFDALIAKAGTPAQRNGLRKCLSGELDWISRTRPTWKAGIARIESLAQELEHPLDAFDLRTVVKECLDHGLVEAARHVASQAPSAVRHEAVWKMADRRGEEVTLDGPLFDVLVDGVETGEYEGRGLVHVAAFVGSAPLLERYRRDLDRPLGPSAEPIWVWSFGPNSDGDRTCAKLELAAGERAVDIVDRILAVLRAGRAGLDQPFQPSAKLKRMLAEYGDNGEVERWTAEREEQKPILDARIQRYEQVRAKLIQLGARATASPAPAAKAAKVTNDVDLPWLLEHLRDAGDDIFNDRLEFRRVFSRGDDVVVEYRGSSAAESMTTAIAWSKPLPTNQRKLKQLIDAIADAD